MVPPECVSINNKPEMPKKAKKTSGRKHKGLKKHSHGKKAKKSKKKSTRRGKRVIMYLK
jgi:hypothetical protein